MQDAKKWTFMVYLAGDNNLSEAGEIDLGEMSSVGSSDDVNIVAEFDRIGDDAHSKRYYVQKDNLKELVDLGETDCGDPNVLLDFISWAAENFHAKRYALILWNHGGGWDKSSFDTISQEVGTRNYGRAEAAERSASPLGRVFFRSTLKRIMSLKTAHERAIASDDGSGHSIDTIELGKVLRLAAAKFKQPIDILGMDACLMSNLEVAYQARDHVKYIVASEENEPFDGWPYNTVLAKLIEDPDIATGEFASHIVDAYIASYANSSYTVTQTAMDLSGVEEIARALDNLADALIAHMPTAAYEIWMAQRSPAANFWHNTLWDISHFCERLEQGTADNTVKQAAISVRTALDPGNGNFVRAESHRGDEVERCGGVTIYLKPPPGEMSRFYTELRYAVDHRWDALLKAYHTAE